MARRRGSTGLASVEPAWGFYALGTVASMLAVAHLLTEGEGLGTLFEGFILLTLAATLSYNGYDVHQWTLSRREAVLALGLTCLFVVSFVLLATALVLIWYLEHGHAHDTRFVLLFAGVLGAAVGGRVNIYAAEYAEAFERTQELTKLLTVNQRVLRHNLRNEVTIVLGYLERAEDSEDAAGSNDLALVRHHLDDLLETSQTARRIVEIWENDAFQPFDVGELLAERVEALHSRHPDVPVTVDCEGVPPVNAHVALPRAIDEVLENAVVHNDDVEIAIDCTRADDGVRIAVSDTGGGIPEDETAVLFQPGETALEHGEGLGLWLVYWTVRRSGGELSFREHSSGGTVVELHLPLAE